MLYKSIIQCYWVGLTISLRVLDVCNVYWIPHFKRKHSKWKEFWLCQKERCFNLKNSKMCMFAKRKSPLFVQPFQYLSFAKNTFLFLQWNGKSFCIKKNLSVVIFFKGSNNWVYKKETVTWVVEAIHRCHELLIAIKSS